MSLKYPPIPWLAPGQDFPDLSMAWGDDSPAPGLLAAGGALDINTLSKAYSNGIFPWFSDGQPILWWSPNPRMMLDVSQFRLHASLRKKLGKFLKTQGCEVRIDSATKEVISSCAKSNRKGQAGTWIVSEMIEAYEAMHHAGLVHSVETWVNEELVGGLYCVAIGKAVFGESMFNRSTDASKIALSALVAFCRHNGIQYVDCQQNTRHLASMGATEITRELFIRNVTSGISQVAPSWRFNPSLWSEVIP